MPLDLGFPKQKGLRLWQDRFRDYVRLPLLRLLHPPRFHSLCIGTSQSGTHSVTHMIEHAYSAWHEPKERETISVSLRQARGEIPHLDRRMRRALGEVLAGSDLVILGTKMASAAEITPHLCEDQVVVDLKRLLEGRASGGNYHGLAWCIASPFI